MNVSPLTVIASYYADSIDPDPPQPSTQSNTIAPRSVQSAPSASLTSNLFLRYFPPRPKAFPPANTEVANANTAKQPQPTPADASPNASPFSSSSASPLAEGAATSACSLAHAIPLAFSASHPLARIAAESSPSGYRGGGVVIWHRPLSAQSTRNNVFPRLNRGREVTWLSSWGWRQATMHAGDGASSDENGKRSFSTSTSSSSSRSSSTSSLSQRQNIVPPAPLHFPDAACHGALVTPAAAAAAAAADNVRNSAKDARGCTQENRENCTSCLLPQEVEMPPLPLMSKIVVVLHVYDWEAENTPPQSKTSLKSRADKREAAEVEVNTIWRMLGPVLWWLERAVQPATELSFAHTDEWVTSAPASAYNPHGNEENVGCSQKEEAGCGGGDALAELRSSQGSRVELDASQNLSLCGSSTLTAAATVSAVPPMLSCAIRLFLSPWAMPRRRRHIILQSRKNYSDLNNTRSCINSCSHDATPLSPPALVPCRWCPRALVELGLCGPNSDSPVLFSAAAFLATLAVNGPTILSDDDGESDDIDGRRNKASREGDREDTYEEERVRHRCRQRQRRDGGGSSSVVPAFGPFPTPHVPSGPQWPGGGGGRRGVATWRTPACATLPTIARYSTTPVTAEAAYVNGVHWDQRPLLQLLSLDGVWNRSSATIIAAMQSGDPAPTSNREDSGEERGEAEEEEQEQQRVFSSCLSPPPSITTPLLPLHTLDLSFRTDLPQIEIFLKHWASTGHLSRLSRLSLMGCIQMRHLDWLADMPAATLEVLNISGCEELRDLHPVRRLCALRSLKAAQLIQLERLGWWWGWEEESQESTKDSEREHHKDASIALLCRLDKLVELDLACFRRRTNCLADIEWIGGLPALRKLAVSVSEEEDPLRQPLWYAQTRNRAQQRQQHRTVVSAATSIADLTRLAWLANCTELRELRLAFRDGPRAILASAESHAAPLHPPDFLTSTLVASVARAATSFGEHSSEAHESLLSDLSILSLHPFPHLRVLELTKAILTEHFTSWLAIGCPQLRDIDLVSCTVRCTTAGLRNAQNRHRYITLPHASANTTAAVTVSPRGRASPPFRHPPPPAHHNRTDQHPYHHDHNHNHRAEDEDDVQQRRKDEQWWWGQLCQLHHLHRLSVFDLEGLTNGSSLDWVVGCPRLRELALRKCRWLLDAYAAHRLPKLRTLNLNATGIDDVTFLRMRDGVTVHEPPFTLQHSRNNNHSNRSEAEAVEGHPQRYPARTASSSSASSRTAALSPVMATLCAYPRQLQRLLFLPSSPVSTTSSLPTAAFPFVNWPLQCPRHFPTLSHLTELVVVDCPFLSDLSPLAYLTSCRSLLASDHPVTSLDHLSTCVSLEKLYLINYAKLTDITALRWLRRLRIVYITHSSIHDVSWVAQPLTAKAISRWGNVFLQRLDSAVVDTPHGKSSEEDAGKDGAWEAGVTAAHSGSASGFRNTTPDRQSLSPTQRVRAEEEGSLRRRQQARRRSTHGVRRVEVNRKAQEEEEEEEWWVLPRLEVLVLAYSTQLTDVSALGALPRLRHLDLRECTHLTQLGTYRRLHTQKTTAVKGVSTPSTPSAAPLSAQQQQQQQESSDSDREWDARHFTTTPLAWASRAVTRISAHLCRLRAHAVQGWATRHRPHYVSTKGVEDASSTHQQQQAQQATPSPISATHLALEGKATPTSAHASPPPSLPSSSRSMTARDSSRPCSLADLAFTLRYLSLSDCKALVDGSVLGELHHLQYLHAAFTGIRDVRWVQGCVSLKVLDLTMSPCCTPGTSSAAAVAFLSRLPDELTELEIVNSRPVERNYC